MPRTHAHTRATAPPPDHEGPPACLPPTSPVLPDLRRGRHAKARTASYIGTLLCIYGAAKPCPYHTTRFTFEVTNSDDPTINVAMTASCGSKDVTRAPPACHSQTTCLALLARWSGPGSARLKLTPHTVQPTPGPPSSAARSPSTAQEPTTCRNPPGSLTLRPSRLSGLSSKTTPRPPSLAAHRTAHSSYPTQHGCAATERALPATLPHKDLGPHSRLKCLAAPLPRPAAHPWAAGVADPLFPAPVLTLPIAAPGPAPARSLAEERCDAASGERTLVVVSSGSSSGPSSPSSPNSSASSRSIPRRKFSNEMVSSCCAERTVG